MQRIESREQFALKAVHGEVKMVCAGGPTPGENLLFSCRHDPDSGVTSVLRRNSAGPRRYGRGPERLMSGPVVGWAIVAAFDWRATVEALLVQGLQS